MQGDYLADERTPQGMRYTNVPQSSLNLESIMMLLEFVPQKFSIREQYWIMCLVSSLPSTP